MDGIYTIQRSPSKGGPGLRYSEYRWTTYPSKKLSLMNFWNISGRSLRFYNFNVRCSFDHCHSLFVRYGFLVYYVLFFQVVSATIAFWRRPRDKLDIETYLHRIGRTGRFNNSSAREKCVSIHRRSTQVSTFFKDFAAQGIGYILVILPCDKDNNVKG